MLVGSLGFDDVPVRVGEEPFEPSVGSTKEGDRARRAGGRAGDRTETETDFPVGSHPQPPINKMMNII